MDDVRDEILDLFDADETVLHLNPGAFGMVPRAVRTVQRRWAERIEQNPLRFFRLECQEELARVRLDVARFLDADADSIALVRNVSEATGIVLDAVGVGPGDEVVVSNHGYPTIAQAALVRGAEVVVADFGIDATDDEIAQAFGVQVGERTKLVVVDQITSPTALVLPVAQVVQAVGGVPVFVDAAHSSGTLQLDIAALGAAFWATNLHKWCFTPRGTGALWVTADWRERARPAVTSWTSEKGFPASHDFPGTIDFTGMLAIPDGLEFWRLHGGLQIAERSRQLLTIGSELVHRRVAMALPDAMHDYDASWPARTAPTMRIIPLPDGAVSTPEDVSALYAALSGRGVECPPVAFERMGLVRLGAGLHNDELDYDRYAEALVAELGRRFDDY